VALRTFVRFRPLEFTRRHTIASVFDLATFSPGLNYQLGLGGLNAFLVRDGQQAIGADNAITTTASSSADFPGGLSARLTYSETDADRYQQNPGAGFLKFLKTTATQRSWPQGAIDWSHTFRNGPVASFSAGSGLERVTATSLSPFADGTNEAVSTTTHATPRMTLTFRNGVFATMAGQFDNSSTSFSGNITETHQSSIVSTVQWDMRLPQRLSRTRRVVRTNVSLTQTVNSTCIQHTGDSTCGPYYDLHRTDVETAFSANLQHGISSGLTFGLVHSADESQGLKSITITLGMFLSIPLSAWGM
jgi:hypothetical protein